jgi:hypothetical protein
MSQENVEVVCAAVDASDTRESMALAATGPMTSATAPLNGALDDRGRIHGKDAMRRLPPGLDRHDLKTGRSS